MKKSDAIILCLFLLMYACGMRKQSSTGNPGNDPFPRSIVCFNPVPENPVFRGTGSGTWDRNIRERGFILYEDSLYKMWYSGYNMDLEQKIMLGYATSHNGINWTRYPGNPIFNKKWTEDMFVFKDEGTYYMYAEGENDVAHLLTSPDGIQWQEQGNLVILSENGDTIPGPYGTPSVWIEDGEWFLFYERNDLGIWLAKTENRITWKNVRDEPVLALGPGEFDKGAVAANQVVRLNGRYYMYYHATSRSDWQNPSSPVTWTSNVAMSTDLVHWTKYPGNPIIDGDYSSPILVFDGEKPSFYTMHPQVCRYITK